LSFANGAGLARQDQENSLEDILAIGFLFEEAPRDFPHHRAVSPHQRREGPFVVLLDETPQQLRIARFGFLSEGGETTEVADGPM
jgi:hypothetical protein